MSAAARWLPGAEHEVTLERAAFCTRCRGDLAAGVVALRNSWGDARHVECPPRAPRPTPASGPCAQTAIACVCHRQPFPTECCSECDPRPFERCIHNRERWEKCSVCAHNGWIPAGGKR